MIHWWLCADPVAAGPWLAPQERRVLDGLRVDKRRRDWLLGRWTAKSLIRTYLQRKNGADVDISHIAVLADDDGAPHAVVAGHRLAASISISHSHATAFCALSASGSIGADIEKIEARSELFVADYLTVEEQSAVASTPTPDRARLINAIWSAKESILKARRTGLREDPRSICCLPRYEETAWQRVATPGRDGTNAWWRSTPDHVLTVAAIG